MGGATRETQTQTDRQTDRQIGAQTATQRERERARERGRWMEAGRQFLSRHRADFYPLLGCDNPLLSTRSQGTRGNPCGEKEKAGRFERRRWAAWGCHLTRHAFPKHGRKNIHMPTLETDLSHRDDVHLATVQAHGAFVTRHSSVAQ